MLAFFDWLLRKKPKAMASSSATAGHSSVATSLDFGKRFEELKRLSADLASLLATGDLTRAETVCQRLAAQSNQLVGTVSGASEEMHLAECLFDLAISQRQLGHDDHAEPTYLSALHLCTAASASEIMRDPARQLMARCNNHLGILYQDAGTFDKAVCRYRDALALRESLLESHPADEENLIFMGGTLCNLGNVARLQNELEPALDFYHRSIDILDRSILGCDCGCRDLHQSMQSFLMGVPTPIALAQQFLRNALQGRAAIVIGDHPEQRYRQIRCSSAQGQWLVVSILSDRLTSAGSAPSSEAGHLQELKRELLDVVSFAGAPIVFDLQFVKAIDAVGVTLLLHLRGRLVGAGEWPSLCGLSNELRAATASVAWDRLFRCFATVEAAVKALNAERTSAPAP